MVNTSFETQAGAVSHDSDIRKLRFVFRNRTTGAEESITAQQILDGLAPNPELLPLGYADPSGTKGLFTEPFELRNRNRAAFEFRFGRPPATTTYTNHPTLAGHDSYGVNVQMGAPGTAEYGFTTNDITFTGTPITLNLGAFVSTLDRMALTITEPASSEGLVGGYCRASIKETSTGRVLLDNIDLMAPAGTVYQLSPDIHYILGENQTLTWQVDINPEALRLSSIASGSFNLSWRQQSMDLTPFSLPIDYTEVQSSFSTVSERISPPVPYDGTARITNVKTIVSIPFAADDLLPHTYMASLALDGVPLWTNRRIDQSDTTGITGKCPLVFDSGAVDIPYTNPGINALTLTVWDDTGGPLLRLNAGMLDFVFTWKTGAVTPSPEWVFGETMSIVAFASLDGEKYTPISMARHDWSNTPFVDIVKFELFNIPDDFDHVPPEPNLSALDDVLFNSSILLFLTDFDNAATWNYLRFYIEWNGATEGPSNQNATLQVIANAREI